jgi:phage tail-like protein
MAISPEPTGPYFVLEVDRVQTVFQSCSGLGSTSEVIDHRVVDQYGKEIVQRIPGRLRWTNLVLKRGLDKSARLWDWRQQIIAGKWPEGRRNGFITATLRDGMPIRRWEFINGWPCEWQASFTEDTSGIVVERIELAYEALRVVSP